MCHSKNKVQDFWFGQMESDFLIKISRNNQKKIGKPVNFQIAAKKKLMEGTNYCDHKLDHWGTLVLVLFGFRLLILKVFFCLLVNNVHYKKK